MQPATFTYQRKIGLIVAGAACILAQALLLVPQTLLPPNITAIQLMIGGSVLYIASTAWIYAITNHMDVERGESGRFFLNQLILAGGIFLLSDTNASHLLLGGFLLTSLNSASIVYGLIQKLSFAQKSTENQTKAIPAAQPALRSSDTNFQYEILREQSAQAAQKLTAEKQKNIQLTYLIELSRQLHDELDPPVAAQLAVNSLDQALHCTVVSLMLYEPSTKEFVALASSGSMTHILPPGLRISADQGVYGRVTRQKKSIHINNTALEPGFIPNNNENTNSMIIVPMVSNGQIQGVMEVRSDREHAFSNNDIATVEGVASELTHAWERAHYSQKLTDLIQSSITLTTQSDAQSCVNEIAILARKVFDARFVFTTLLSQQEELSRTAVSGEAPLLLESLSKNLSKDPLAQAALNTVKPFRVRDVRKYSANNTLEIDDPGLRSVIAVPIRLHRFNIGMILAFGKQDGIFFTKEDESLADLFSSQAAAAVESSWLTQELRNTLQTTSMLRQLSDNVIMADEISNAAEEIARTAHKTTNAEKTGIVLMTPEGEIQAKVELDASGFRTTDHHPMEIIHQVMQTGQNIITWLDNRSLVCYPLLTHSRPAGAIWMHMPERESHGHNFDMVRLLANQAAVSLERVNLLVESRRQAREIEAAYEELEVTYDLTLKALMSALDARDQETEGHSMRVSRVAKLLGEKMGLSSDQLKGLERGALLHDIGKIGISDSILHKPGKLTDEEWKIMRLHPEIGARIIERIPFLQESMSVVRYHHERWNGSGYPLGLTGDQIPIEARIFAVADVFDALTSSRIYRTKSSPAEAVEYLKKETGILFDGDIVEALSQIPYDNFVEGERIS